MGWLVVAAVVALVVTAANVVLVLARRRAPEGGIFVDSDRAAGVFGVVGTGFAVLLAFVIFIAFESYNSARNSAAVEAVAVRQLFRTASLFEPQDQAGLQEALVCYGRAVIDDEWRTMRDGRESPLVDGWLDRFEAEVAGVDLSGPRQEAAFEHWLEQAGVRQEGRRGRLAEATPFVPKVVWVVLVAAGLLVIAYVACYADPVERLGVQLLMMTTVTVMVCSGLVLIFFLDRPYENRDGSIRPVAMTQAVRAMESRLDLAALPCAPDGTFAAGERPGTASATATGS